MNHPTRTRLALLLTALTLLALSVAPPAAAAVRPPGDRDAIFRAFERQDYRAAATLLEQWTERDPSDAQMLYNLACAYARLGERDRAARALYRAVEAGFQDFAHMRDDPDLDGLRDDPVYGAIMEASRRVDHSKAESGLERWRRRFGERSYRYQVDAERRLAFAAALDEVSFREMQEMLEREADHLVKTLFEAPPDYYVLIAVPTPEDGKLLFPDDNIGGRYEHYAHQIVTREIGGSLRHELVHAYHYGHMERLGVRTPHPLWIQEGLAALFEDYEWSADGTITFLPNERTNVSKRLARSGRLMKWSDLFEMGPDRFMQRAGRMYPQARSIFAFLADEGKLTTWYRTFVEHYAEDQTGRLAFELVFDASIKDVEQRWRRWVRDRPTLDVQVGYGDAALGIESDANSSNDGVMISTVRPGSAASRALLRKGDVIVSVDGEFTRSIQELLKIIGTKEVGDRVEVRVRRRGRYFTKGIVLQALR